METDHFARLVDLELAIDPEVSRGRGDVWLVEPPRDLAGLALSGGGIRSATFNLGLLQGLDEAGLLGSFDYLSTVSGGGYVGGFWTAWRARRSTARADAMGDSPDARVFPPRADPVTGKEDPAIRHLRQFSRFLAPHLGVFSFDTGRMLIALVNAVVPSLLGSLALMTLLLLASVGVAAIVLVVPIVVTPAMASRGLTVAPSIVAAFFFALYSLSHYLVMLAIWRRSRSLPPSGGARLETLRERDEDRNPSLLLWLIGAGVIVGSSILWGLYYGAGADARLALDTFRAIRQQEPFMPADAVWRYMWSPALVWLLTAGLLAAVRGATSRHHGSTRASWRWRRNRRILDQAGSWALFAAAAWMVIVALWWAAFWLWSHFPTLSASALWNAVIGATGLTASGLLGRAAKFFSQRAATNARASARAGRATILVLSYGLLVLLIVAVELFLIRTQYAGWVPAWLGASDGTGLEPLLVPLVAALAVAALAFGLYEPNEIGLHQFYRGRLARAYLGASLRNTADEVEERAADDVRITDVGVRAPFHLVCAAVNDLSPKKPLENLSRGAVSAVLSPVAMSVGTHWARWAARRPAEGVAASAPAGTGVLEPPTLGAALTASAAAFNTQMGAKSVDFGVALTYLMTTLGLRLGLWMPNPRFAGAGAKIPRRVRRGVFFKELFGLSSADDEDVLLSDGGHFENMAFYELIRRHCRYVMVSDCGQDSEVAFDDFGNAVRRVREDFGVEVRIDLSPLRTGASGLAGQPMVAGDVYYPNGDIGVLLYFKPTIIGTEPPDIAQYRARNQSFPHESTSDQFYDEAQWESYRSLGYFAAREAFRQIDVRAIEPPGDRVADAFARARRDWFSVPEDLGERATRVAQVVGALDEELHRAGNDLLLRQVYPESAAATGNPARPDDAPARDELLSSLALVRKAIVSFEALFLAERLARRYNEPIYLGLTNYMARWATTRLFRFWWPVLSGTCTDGFRRFVGSQLGVADEPVWEVVTGPLPADAVDLTRLRGPDREGGEGATHFVLTVTYAGSAARAEDRPESNNAAGTARMRVVVARARPRPLGGDAVWWPSDDLAVPIGLWGVGIGTRFLRALLTRLGDAVERAYVLVPPPSDATYAARKAVADVAQLYRHSGFDTASADEAAALRTESSVRETLGRLSAERLVTASGSMSGAGIAAANGAADGASRADLAPAPTWLVYRKLPSR